MEDHLAGVQKDPAPGAVRTREPQAGRQREDADSKPPTPQHTLLGGCDRRTMQGL